MKDFRFQQTNGHYVKNHEPIHALGIHFCYNQERTNSLNFEETLHPLEKKKQKQKQNRNSWKRRKLSLVGKVDNIKTPGLSKLIYHSSLLTVPKPLVLNRVNKIKPPKMISGEKYRDCLKMIESEIMERSLKIA